MKRQTHTSVRETGRIDVTTTPTEVAERYAENLRRLAREAGKMDRPTLAQSLYAVADLMDDMAEDILPDDELGAHVLRRVCRLIGTVERLLDMQAKASILH